MKPVDEKGQSEQTEDDARHTGQGADEDAQHTDHPAVGRGVLDQVNRRDDAHGHGEQHGPDGQVDRPQKGGPDAAEHAVVFRIVRQETPVESPPWQEHRFGLLLDIREQTFEPGALEALGARHQLFLLPPGLGVQDPPLLVQDFFKDNLRPVPPPLAIAVPGQVGAGLGAGKRAEQLDDAGLDLVVGPGQFPIPRRRHRLQLLLKVFQGLEDRPAGLGHLVEFRLELVGISPVVPGQQVAPMLDRPTKDKGRGPARDDRREDNRQGGPHEQNGENPQSGERPIKQFSRRKLHGLLYPPDSLLRLRRTIHSLTRLHPRLNTSRHRAMAKST